MSDDDGCTIQVIGEAVTMTLEVHHIVGGVAW